MAGGLYGSSSGSKSGLYGGGGSGSGGESSPNIFSRLFKHVPAHKQIGQAAGLPLGLTGNLLSDVKDAVVGIPMGLVMTVEHPVTALKAMAGGTWQTWKPLLTGHPVAFVEQTYDHPLAPILDVATVFSLGAASAAKAAPLFGDVADAASTAGKLAKLNQPGVKLISDPKGTRLPVEKTLSRRAGRRAMQELTFKYRDKLPQWYLKGQYEMLHRTDVAHRFVAKEYIKGQAMQKVAGIESAMAHNDRAGLVEQAQNFLEHTDPTDGLYGSTRLQMEAIIQGAHAMEDITDLGKRARSTVLAHMHANLMRHNKAYTIHEAKSLLESGHNVLVKAPEYMDGTYWKGLDRLTRTHARLTRKYATRRPKLEAEIEKWDRIRQQSAELVHSHAGIKDELARANDEMSALQEAGSRVAGGYTTRTGRQPAKLTPTQEMNYRSEAVWEQQQRIQRLEQLNEKAYAAKKTHEKALRKLEALRTERTQSEANLSSAYEDLQKARDRSAESFYASHADTYEKTMNAVENFGEKVSTKDFGKAAHIVGEDGHIRYYVVPKHDAYNLGYEGGNSLRFIHKVLHKSTMMWKTAVIGYTPRTITNNAIGNWFLYATREMPSAHGAMAVADAIRYRFGRKIDADPLFKDTHWAHRWFADELGDQFGVGNEIMDLAGKGGAKATLRAGFYPAVAGIEKNQRIMTLYSALRSMPEVRAEIAAARKQGLRGSKAADVGIERAMRKNPALRDEAALSSRRLMGDYVSLSETEKFLRDIIPFYLWNRHILKTTGNMLLEQPGRLLILQQLSELGISETEKQLGQIPDFLKGAIPLAALGFGDKTGRANVMLTASLNPFATVGDLAASVEAWTSGQRARRGEAVNQFNPFITSSFESIFQTSLLTGSPSPREGGILTDVLSRSVLTLPQPKLVKALTSKDQTQTPKGNDYLYARDDRSQWSSLLGVPLRNVSQETAAKLAALESKTKEKKTVGGLYS